MIAHWAYKRDLLYGHDSSSLQQLIDRSPHYDMSGTDFFIYPEGWPWHMLWLSTVLFAVGIALAFSFKTQFSQKKEFSLTVYGLLVREDLQIEQTKQWLCTILPADMVTQASFPGEKQMQQIDGGREERIESYHR